MALDVNAQPDAGPSVAEQPLPASMATIPQPVQPAPSPAQPIAPQPTQPTQPLQPAEPPHHLNALAGVLAAIAGPDVTHSVDPQTGKITTTATPPTPGNAFRKILAGALTGMGAGAAAGAEGHPGAGILGGIGAGGTAVMNRQQTLNQQDIQNKQTEFENQQKATENQQRAKLQEATIALHNAEMLNQRRTADRMDEEDFLKSQAASEKFIDQVTSKGGEKFPIVVGGEDINGKPGNWEQMRAYFTNPDNLKPPAGYHYVYNTTYDTSGLHREGNQWADKNGDPVDLNSRASETVALYPDTKLNETFNITPEEFEKISGFKAPAAMGKSIPVTMSDLIGMNTKRVAGENQKLRIDLRGALTPGQEFNQKKEGLTIAEKPLGADFRLSAMEQNYQDALKGNQQAMVSLLTNHIGMTLGLQKGARITKDILHEAAKSQPWLENVKARWSSDGYLEGVVLGKKEMNEMVGLARQQRQLAWDEANTKAKYMGINLPPSTYKGAGAGGGPQGTAPANPTPATHIFHKSAWATANPGKDVDAAAKQATSQGYEVQP